MYTLTKNNNILAGSIFNVIQFKFNNGNFEAIGEKEIFNYINNVIVEIEDNCFIGTGSQITEGVIVGEGSVIASGTIIASGVKIINRETNEILHGKIPPYSVVVGGCYKSTNDLYIKCAIIIKQIDENIRTKTSINDLLR